MKEKIKIILIFITLLISLLSLFLSVLSLASFIYLQDLHTKTTVTSSNTQMMLLERILCLEGDKEACEPNHQEKHQNN
jgi:hypothetical protein